MLRISAIIIGLIFAFAFSQFPEYAQQYEQRLGGAVDELTTIVADFDASAARAGLDREQALAEYDNSATGFLNERGVDMRRTIARQQKLFDHLVAVQNQDVFGRMVGMAQYFDSELSMRTLEAYAPAVPASVDGLIFLAGGFVLGALGTSGVWQGARRIAGRGRNRSASASTGRSR